MQNQKFKIKPSLIYTSILLLLTITSMAVVMAINTSALIKLGLMVCLLAYAFSVIWRHVLFKSKLAVTSVEKMADTYWQVTTNTGVFIVSLRGDSVISPFLSVLRFDSERHKRPLACVLCRDSLAKDGYRRFVAVARMS